MNFEVQMYGEPTLLSDVLSKRRVRIFYKYENRNLTYITDDFAEELISSLPYTPVKGIYEDQDFQAHGAVNSEGKIYGIVPQDMNFAWEPHLDEDGIERVYACCDVYIFSALYPEAEVIKFKSQSMELFRPTLKYHHEIIKGQRYTVFDHGCFIGLQVLGDNFEPCFEGAAFYSLGSSEVEKLRDSINDVIEKIKSYSYKGEERMAIPNFKLSDDQKFNALWTLLNPNFTEEQDWLVNCSISDVYDDYCIFFNYEDKNTYRAYYTKDDETDSVKIDSVEKVFILDVTEAEKATLDTLRRLNGDTYELVSEVLDNAQDVDAIVNDDSIPKLFLSESSNYRCISMNWGASKGIDSFMDVCVVLNKNTLSLFLRGELANLKSVSKNKLYVACTRAHRHLYISPSLKSHIQPFPITYTDHGK